jgi:exopolysaccharide biosynthesis polyprenyl glycosylphosphotransferase
MAATNIKQKLFFRLKAGERRVIILIGDLIASLGAIFIALYVWSRASEEWLEFSIQFLLERPPTWFYILPVIWIILLIVLGDIRKSNNYGETIASIGMAAMLSAIIYLFIFFLAEPNSLPRLGVALFFISATVFTLIWRFFYIQIFTAPTFLRRVIIVGAGNAGKTLVDIVKNTWPIPFYLVGLIDDDENKIGTNIEGFPVLGGGDELLQIIEEKDISDVIFAISGEMRPQMLESLLMAEERGIEVTTMPVIYEEVMGRVPIFLLNQDWVLRSLVDQSHISRSYQAVKRLIDVAGGIVGSLIFLIAIPILSVLILIDDGRPVFYKQSRLGRNGKIYRILKFRTMNDEDQIEGGARPTQENDLRVTKIGKFLRRSHLDELPQFINILKGDMSLVGPRAEQPIIVEELQAKIPFYRSRLFVKPGLTGWAQINYGYASNAEQNAIKLEFDLYYIKHRNLMLDISILFQTLGSVIGLKGR